MTITRHELRQGRTAFLIWTGSIGFLLAVCIFLFPEMKGQMDSINSLFSSMGAFTSAFGMDKLNFGSLTGYYAVECGNVLGLGGAFYAALYAAGILSKEEKDRTAEFLLTHPVSRARIVTEKLAAVLIWITAMNIFVWLLAAGAIAAVGEPVPWSELNRLHLACFLMQLELAGICFGVSAFTRRGSLGVGLGIAALMYFLNLIANISDTAAFLSYVTPFGYCNGSDIVAKGGPDAVKVAVGMADMAAGIAAAYLKYTRKDIH